MIAVGYVVEKHYVSRVTTFTNALAVTVSVITHGGSWIIGLYADIGLVVGLLGLQAYRKNRSMSTAYYEFSAVFYSSVVAGAVIIYPELRALFSYVTTYPDLLVIFLILIIFIFNLFMIIADESLIYKGARPIQVNEFIANAEFRFPKERRWYSVNNWFDVK
jgi:hypothetical protein